MASRSGLVTNTVQRPFVFLLLGVISALVGFGGVAAGNVTIDAATLLPECLDGVIIGLSKIMAVIFLLLFVVSACFGRHLDS